MSIKADPDIIAASTFSRLAETAVNNCMTSETPWFDKNWPSYSGLDRAQRQPTTAYQLLVQLKRPPLKVQVKAKTAFVAQNQQLNVAEAKKE